MSSFGRVRNEVAYRDWIVRLASLRLIPGMGRAGVTGFHESAFAAKATSGSTDLIHTNDVRNGCRLCNGRAGIHNVTFPQEFRHNDPFVGLGHIETFWLPFLWNLDSAEYSKFLEICQVASELKSQKDQVKLNLIEEYFRVTHWEWADSQTVVSLIENQLRARHKLQQGKRLTPAMQDIADRVLACLWDVVADSAKVRSESSLEADPKTKEKLASLYPRIAVTRAVDSIMRSSKQQQQQQQRRRGRGF